MGDGPQSRVGINCGLVEGRVAAGHVVARYALQSADVVVPYGLSVKRFPVLRASAAKAHEAAATDGLTGSY